MWRPDLRVAVWVGAAACLPGCGSADVAPVAGRVTLDGRPLPGVQVNFFPVATEARPAPGYPSMSQSVTDADGRYVLVNPTTGQAGAVVGPHRVCVNTPVPDNHPVHTSSTAVYFDPLPPKYSTPSALTFDVPPGGTAGADFHLESDRQYAPPVSK